MAQPNPQAPLEKGNQRPPQATEGPNTWLGHQLLRVVLAFSAAVVINGLLAIGMALWADLGHPPRRARAPRQPPVIPLVKTPPPKKKPQPVTQRSQPDPLARAPLPAINLPSAIAVPVFDPQALVALPVVHPPQEQKPLQLGPQTILTEDMVDEPPRPLLRVPLRYPKSAEAQGIQGEVDARLLLDVNGAVLQVRIVSATPPGVFEQAARESLAQWRFAPATFRGHKLKAWVRQRVRFRLR